MGKENEQSSLDRSFKYAMMDTSRVYIGGRLSYGEMIEWEDVPFKLKGIVNKEFLPDAGSTEFTFADHFKVLKKDSFAFQVFKTLKTRIKVDYPVLKKGKTGDSVIYKSRVCNIEEYLDWVGGGEANLTLSDGSVVEPVTEEISFSKLAMMIFSA